MIPAPPVGGPGWSEPAAARRVESSGNFGPESRYIATAAEKLLDSHANGVRTRGPVANPKNEISEPNLASVADVSRFPGILDSHARIDGDEYAILAPVHAHDSPETSWAVHGQPVEPVVDAAYLCEERVGIQEFGT